MYVWLIYCYASVDFGVNYVEMGDGAHLWELLFESLAHRWYKIESIKLSLEAV